MFSTEMGLVFFFFFFFFDHFHHSTICLPYFISHKQIKILYQKLLLTSYHYFLNILEISFLKEHKLLAVQGT